MVFQNWKLFATGLSQLNTNQANFTVPINFRAQFNIIKLKYVSICGYMLDGSASRNLWITGKIVSTPWHTSNLEAGTVILGPSYASGTMTATPENAIALKSSGNAAHFDSEVMIGNEFSIVITAAPEGAAVLAAGDDYFLDLTIGYDV